MNIEKITSRDNKYIKLAGKLNSSAKTRSETGLFVLEGLRLCLDALNSELSLEYLFFTEEILKKRSQELQILMGFAKKSYEITVDLARKISDSKNSQGVFGICKTLDKTLLCNKIENMNGKYIALQNIQDPSNLGAISRTAEAFGMSGMIVCSGCDRYNPKALRASMGSLLRIKYIETGDLFKLLTVLKDKGFLVCATVPDPEAVSIKDIPSSKDIVAVIGNEANGLTKDIIDNFSNVTIPMKGKTESLNAAMAAGIIIWSLSTS